MPARPHSGDRVHVRLEADSAKSEPVTLFVNGKYRPLNHLLQIVFLYPLRFLRLKRLNRKERKELRKVRKESIRCMIRCVFVTLRHYTPFHSGFCQLPQNFYPPRKFVRAFPLAILQRRVTIGRVTLTSFSQNSLMTEQKTLPPQDIAAQCACNKPIPECVADRFGISGFRTEKFANHDEDSSKVDRCSDSPAVMEAFEVFFNAK